MKPRSSLFIVLIATLALLSACGSTVQTTLPTIAPAPTAAPAPTVAPTPAPTVATRSDAVIAARSPLELTPGVFSYSDSGYILAGRIVEQVSGMPYEAFLQARIFDPLGMADTGYGTTAERLARGYTSATVAAEMFEPTVDYAAGGVYSTVEDLLR